MKRAGNCKHNTLKFLKTETPFYLYHGLKVENVNLNSDYNNISFHMNAGVFMGRLFLMNFQF